MCLGGASRSMENQCGYAGRILVEIAILIAWICSFLSTFTCTFYKFETYSGVPFVFSLPPPFNQARAANVGLFSYKITDATLSSLEMDSCETYDEQFRDLQVGNEWWIAAQCCAVTALVVAALCLVLNMVALCCCSFYCSFIVTSLLLLTTAVLQACSFFIFGDTEICTKTSCQLGAASILSMVAVVLYAASGLVLCCIPRPDPCIGNVCCKKKDGKDEKKKDDDDDEKDDDDEPKKEQEKEDDNDEEQGGEDDQDDKEEEPQEEEEQPQEDPAEENDEEAPPDDEEEEPSMNVSSPIASNTGRNSAVSPELSA